MKIIKITIFSFLFKFVVSNLINDAINLSQATYCINNEWNCKTCDKNKTVTKIPTVA